MAHRILLIDDHQIIRDGLNLLLRGQSDLELTGSAFTSEAGWEAVQRLQPDLVIMDLNVPTEGGLALTERIGAEYPAIKVVILSGYLDPAQVEAAMAAGAAGYVLKGHGFLVLVDAIRTALAGKTYLCPDVSTVLVRRIQQSSRGVQSGGVMLSVRETQVLKQLADGATTKEIAYKLGLSTKTVETHRVNVMSKLGLKSIAELTKYAVREGLTKL